MKRSLMQRWHTRGGRKVRLVLSFPDIMEFALALLSLTPKELEGLGWSLADRDRLLSYFLTSGKLAHGIPVDRLDDTAILVGLPQRDVEGLQRFARQELPKAASNAAMLDRVLGELNRVSRRRS